MKPTRAGTIAAVALLVLGALEPATAFVPDMTHPSGPASACPQRNRWAVADGSAVLWHLNPTLGPKVHGDLSSVVATLESSFATWTTAPNTILAAQRGADSIVRDQTLDGDNVISFNPSQSLPPGVLAVTFTVTSDIVGEEFPAGSGRRSQYVGQLLDADIIFNPAEDFAVPARLTSSECLDASGSAICFDLETIATHEIGHVFGLSHTGVWGAMLWPFAAPAGTFTRELAADDRAGIASLYPVANFQFMTGRIAGRVVDAFGQPVFGAHVVAVNATSGATVVSTIAFGQCVNGQIVYDGSYLLEGLETGSYQVFAEPLDGPTAQGDYSEFFTGFVTPPRVNTGFTTRAH